MKLCYALRHVPFESLGLLGPLLAARGIEVRVLDVPVVELPKNSLRDAELVIVLGGPIGAYEERAFPFLSEELQLLEDRLAHKKATIGICLGAQLMARALGARVYPGTQKEIGWSRLQLTEQGIGHALRAVDQQPVLHWHGDTFDLPKGASLLASTQITPHQAFAWQDAAVALQFHLEVTAQDLEAWYVGHASELSQWAKMPIPELRARGRTFAPSLEPHAARALAELLDAVLNASHGPSSRAP